MRRQYLKRRILPTVVAILLITELVVEQRVDAQVEPRGELAAAPSSISASLPVESDEELVTSSAASPSVFGEIVFMDTGGDRCTDATVIAVPAGPPGEPNSITILGSTSAATGPDCGGVFSAVWWEAFELDTCADVTIEFCGSFPFRTQPIDRLAAGCANAGARCSPFYTAATTELTLCPSGEKQSGRVRFHALPPGVYHYPLEKLNALIEDYVLQIYVEECIGDCAGCTGACCHGLRRDCEDDVPFDDCRTPGLTFTARRRCAELECRSAGLEYDAFGVALQSRVAVTDFDGASTAANDISGYVSPSGREYALLGLNNSTGFVDITDPTAPVIVADVPDARSPWSDPDTFGTYAYNVNEADGGLQVIDLTQIDQGLVSTLPALTSNGLRTSHTFFVNQESGFLYLCGANAPTTGLIAVDLSLPANPMMVGLWTEHYVHEVFVKSFAVCPYVGRIGPCELAYAFATNAGMYVLDVTDKSAMTKIGQLLYPNVSICHQGWMTEDENYILINDEGDETRFDLPTTTYVIDVSDPTDPALMTTFTNGLAAIDHNLMIRGHLVFEANYTTGLHVYDISDIQNAREVAFFDTYPADNSRAFNGAWGVYAHLPSGLILISDIQRGLFVLKLCENATLIPGDYDDDGDADLNDFARLQRCFTGESTAPPAECRRVDTNCDGRIDLRDVDMFLSVPAPIVMP